jgi:hypothetical protein
VAWTAFNMPAVIQQNLRQIAITYGPDRARFVSFCPGPQARFAEIYAAALKSGASAAT